MAQQCEVEGGTHLGLAGRGGGDGVTDVEETTLERKVRLHKADGGPNGEELVETGRNEVHEAATTTASSNQKDAQLISWRT